MRVGGPHVAAEVEVLRKGKGREVELEEDDEDEEEKAAEVPETPEREVEGAWNGT